MDLSNNHVYLTGASGFIGGAIHNSLKGKHPLTALNREDISARIDQLKFDPDSTLIHSAALVHMTHKKVPNIMQEYRKINRDITLALARQGLASGVKRFIFISSLMVLGNSKTIDPLLSPQPDEPYGISKWEAEQGLEELFSSQKDARCITLRLPMVYGPGNKGNMLPLLKAASLKIPLPLAKARGKRSMIFIGNVCSAIETILGDKLKRPTVETYIINDRHDMTSGQLYSLIFKSFHGKIRTFPISEKLLRAGGQAGSFIEKAFGKSMLLNKQNVARLFDEYSFSSDSFCHDYNWNPPFTPEEG
ncbi:MAG: NAD-dependent epimerase/dehydratase family protein, partial [Mariprofundaceae bacterium]